MTQSQSMLNCTMLIHEKEQAELDPTTYEMMFGSSDDEEDFYGL